MATKIDPYLPTRPPLEFMLITPLGKAMLSIYDLIGMLLDCNGLESLVKRVGKMVALDK